MWNAEACNSLLPLTPLRNVSLYSSLKRSANESTKKEKETRGGTEAKVMEKCTEVR